MIQNLCQDSLTLSDYFTKLKTLWSTLENCEELDDPCTCGKAPKLQQKAERAKIVKFLAGLNECYDVIRRQIIIKKTLPSLTEVYNILDQDDSQKSFITTISPTAFQVSEIVTSPQALIKISGVGNIRLNKHLLLQNVLFIHEFCLHLISISFFMTDQGSRVIFDPSCEIHDHTKAVKFGQGRRIGNMYVLGVEDNSTMVNAVVDTGTWHNMLGHASISRVDLISDALGTTR